MLYKTLAIALAYLQAHRVEFERMSGHDLISTLLILLETIHFRRVPWRNKSGVAMFAT